MASQCVCCRKKEETIHHLFFEGDWASGLWNFMQDIFEYRRPSSVDNLIEDWITPYRRKEAKSNLRLGLICIGLHYIWNLRNSIRHDDPQKFDNRELMRWAGFLANIIPKGDADNKGFRKIQILLRIPHNIQSTVQGRWAIWEPDCRGLTMDVAISEDCMITAILVRDNQGKFVMAANRSINRIGCEDDLSSIIENWKDKVDRLTTIYYAHHFNYSGRRVKEVTIKKVHPLVLRAAMSLCFKRSLPAPLVNMNDLPLATQRIMWQDSNKLHNFCPTEHASNDQMQPKLRQTVDDNSNKRRHLTHHEFADDNNINRC